jgi:hypothetical protein
LTGDRTMFGTTLAGSKTGISSPAYGEVCRIHSLPGRSPPVPMQDDSGGSTSSTTISMKISSSITTVTCIYASKSESEAQSRGRRSGQGRTTSLRLDKKGYKRKP